ncbi:hypothetical protein ABES02_29535 [Neobacillus pocheonensis]|uniref:hypothetical protein n=1 Tax=Neobacillus pocheonensis TaxID=363869 RepID=UPI003D26EE28
MTNPTPHFTAASQTVVLPSLNGFQQGSNGNLPRTFRNGRYLRWSHIGRITLRFALRWTITFYVPEHAQHAPARAIVITTEGRRKQNRLHLAIG